MKKYKYHFTEKESDITIISDSKKAILKAKEVFYYHRNQLEKYIYKNKTFLTSFSPIKIYSEEPIIKLMDYASKIADVGPMAAVAGALADLMLNSMKQESNDFIPAKVALVENGGEIAIDSEENMKIGLFAGYNPLNLNIGFLIKREDCPIGIGTSSATIGHAISFGEADAVTIFAKNAAIADAVATKIGNIVKGNDIEKSIKKALDKVDDFDGVRGAFISRGNKVGYTGKIPELFKINKDKIHKVGGKFERILQGDFEILK